MDEKFQTVTTSMDGGVIADSQQMLEDAESG